MTKTNHTPEPWEAVDWFVEKNGRLVAMAGDFGIKKAENLQIANAHRIVACVNACAGFTTKALENIRDNEKSDYIVIHKTLVGGTKIKIYKEFEIGNDKDES